MRVITQNSMPEECYSKLNYWSAAIIQVRVLYIPVSYLKRNHKNYWSAVIIQVRVLYIPVSYLKRNHNKNAKLYHTSEHAGSRVTLLASVW